MIFGDALNDRTLLSSMGLCGYMRTASGRDVALTIYVNNALGEVADAVEDMRHICEAIYLAY
ncbi:MAG: hypothetical protein QUS08_02490 [Methanothrix sp.]|nr:hypothetical protein [Methanothrix sp.]